MPGGKRARPRSSDAPAPKRKKVGGAGDAKLDPSWSYDDDNPDIDEVVLRLLSGMSAPGRAYFTSDENKDAFRGLIETTALYWKSVPDGEGWERLRDMMVYDDKNREFFDRIRDEDFGRLMKQFAGIATYIPPNGDAGPDAKLDPPNGDAGPDAKLDPADGDAGPDPKLDPSWFYDEDNPDIDEMILRLLSVMSPEGKARMHDENKDAFREFIETTALYWKSVPPDVGEGWERLRDMMVHDGKDQEFVSFSDDDFEGLMQRFASIANYEPPQRVRRNTIENNSKRLATRKWGNYITPASFPELEPPDPNADPEWEDTPFSAAPADYIVDAKLDQDWFYDPNAPDIDGVVARIISNEGLLGAVTEARLKRVVVAAAEAWKLRTVYYWRTLKEQLNQEGSFTVGNKFAKAFVSVVGVGAVRHRGFTEEYLNKRKYMAPPNHEPGAYMIDTIYPSGRASAGNRGYVGVLTAMNVHSRYVYHEKLRSLKATHVMPAVEAMVRRMKADGGEASKSYLDPKHFVTDGGPEFKTAFQTFAVAEGITTAVTERYTHEELMRLNSFHRHLRTLLKKIIDAEGGGGADRLRWEPIIDDAIVIHNTRKHSQLKTRPVLIKASAGRPARPRFYSKRPRVGEPAPPPIQMFRRMSPEDVTDADVEVLIQQDHDRRMEVEELVDEWVRKNKVVWETTLPAEQKDLATRVRVKMAGRTAEQKMNWMNKASEAVVWSEGTFPIVRRNGTNTFELDSDYPDVPKIWPMYLLRIETQATGKRQSRTAAEELRNRIAKNSAARNKQLDNLDAPRLEEFEDVEDVISSRRETRAQKKSRAGDDDDVDDDDDFTKKGPPPKSYPRAHAPKDDAKHAYPRAAPRRSGRHAPAPRAAPRRSGRHAPAPRTASRRSARQVDLQRLPGVRDLSDLHRIMQKMQS